ncbi:acid-sensing ion channel 3-like [Babylonia areolata]|uniref:acid-sensing ion channel 3-like n=1 Tax=Babylonia areolata TaxID=304850 RepID=UPI003FD194A8
MFKANNKTDKTRGRERSSVSVFEDREEGEWGMMDKRKKRREEEEEEEEEGEGREGRLWHIFTQFIGDTTIHGVKNASDSTKSVFDRAVWAVLVAVAVGSLLMLLSSLFLCYYEYPVRTLVTVSPTARLPFPSVTLCNLNGMEMSKLKAQDTETCNMTAVFQNLTLAGVHLAARKPWDVPVEDRTGSCQLLNQTFQKISRQAFADLNSTLMQCLWDEEEVSCDRLFTPVDLDSRRCFQFNAAAGAGRKASRSRGLYSGLEVILHVRQSEYSFSAIKSASAGIQVILHEPEEMVDELKGFVLSPGFTHYVQIVMTKYNFLPAPYKAFGENACVRDAELPEAVRQSSRQNVSYTRALCQYSCIHALAQAECGCRISETAFTENLSLPLCTMSDVFTCYYALYENLTRWHDSCACPELCHRTEYGVTMSSAYFPSLVAQRILHNLGIVSKQAARKNVLVLKLYYEDLISYEISHVPKYTVETILGTMGGQMGLLLGASLLSVAEVLHLLLTLCRRAARAFFFPAP